MKTYTYQNTLIGKKQLRQLLAWSFTNYDSMQASFLADELKYLGFKYASQAGISISIEDLRIPFVKSGMLEKANQEIDNSEKIFFKGKITEVERFQKIIDTWSLTSESLKNQIVYYFKNYDPLNSVYIMAFSGARGNLSQVRQLVGMRGLMSDPSGQIMNLPIKKNFREGLTITDYLMSGYGARKGIVDTALKTANSGYLTRRLIDVSQDIVIREKDCLTTHSLLFSIPNFSDSKTVYEKILGRVAMKPILDPETFSIITESNGQITPELIQTFQKKHIQEFWIRSPLTCKLYRSICQKCYGWDLSTENLVDIGEAIGIIAGQSIGEPGTQLTMRTFHTGGIFTSEARQQIISPINGVVQFYRQLKTVVLRTNRGEDVLVTKNSGSLVLIPESLDQNLTTVDIPQNTILFPKNNQYISKDTVIGEVINTKKQTKTETKTILSDTCGEIFIPKLKQKINGLTNNRLIWILEGQLYNSPIYSFLNFYPDYKLNSSSYVFRTKLINHYRGIVGFVNTKNSLYDGFVTTNNYKYSLKNSKFEKLKSSILFQNYILTVNRFKYFVSIQDKYSKTYFQSTRDEKFGRLITNSFLTLTGGSIFYKTRTDKGIPFYTKGDCHQVALTYLTSLKKKIREQLSKKLQEGTRARYLHQLKKVKSFQYEFLKYLNKYEKNREWLKIKDNPTYRHQTMVWLGEEVYKFKFDPTILLVEEGDFIPKGFELIPDCFSQTSGIIALSQFTQDKTTFQVISIKSGVLYKGKKRKKFQKEVYYPGETLFSTINITNLSLCDGIGSKGNDQLLVRSIQLYEIPLLVTGPENFQQETNSQFCLKQTFVHSYKSKQRIYGGKNLNLIANLLLFKTNNFLKKNIHIELRNNRSRKSVDFHVIEKLSLNNYILPNLRDKNIQPCFLVQKNQFLSNYHTLGYLERLNYNSREIVQFKIKKQNEKQIFLISNENCITVKRNEIRNKTVNDFVLNRANIRKTGKIIIENKEGFTIQKGRPYFFPNCSNNSFGLKANLKYKIIPQFKNNLKINQDIMVNYYDLKKLFLRKTYNFKSIQQTTSSSTYQFSKFFLKNAGKFYSCLIPQFSKKFTIQDKDSTLNLKTLLLSSQSSLSSNQIQQNDPKTPQRTILLQNSELIFNPNRKTTPNSDKNQLTLVKFMEHPFPKSAKAVGLYSITEDFFEQERNSVFCKNTEFIDSGKTLGFLNLEKEITGDIVQGLPRIEEILEARKKNLLGKRIPTSQKKGLLTQKTSLDINFEFQKVGTTIKENEKINPHKLVKAYFNYYGLLKFFSCDRTKLFHYGRLTTNYEASHKSFKKVQLFMLDSIQSVYKSQGVTINDRHLEVIIKQMTTKVLITSEGDTPLLQREVIDLYHIHYMNTILNAENKQIAYYVPFLLGITKAALNNPSFISAASFQETTRVLTKAAIEGRIDWLRGLKENIIIGHLIPAGTGSPNYRNSFQQKLVQPNLPVLESLEFSKSSGQIQ
jgi:RNA polymerase Rpb1, domain 5/RNA polymerase Rpb1, domain 4